MKPVIITICALLAATSAAPASQSLTFQDDGSYRFYYETGEEGGSHSRTEVRHPDGSVIGKFSYQDPDGDMREVNYKADGSGYVAQGDVGVKGAPKGQFPAVVEEQPQEPVPPDTAASTHEELPEEEPKGEESRPQTESPHQDDSHLDEEDKDEMQDLTLEESAADYPPDGFPPGFFLQKFHGLRRLPEPTKEPKPSTTESSEEENSDKSADDKTEPAKAPTESGEKAKPGEKSSVLTPLTPFHALSPQEWASAMFHQPVYVFAYNQPDSYGYHYFFK